VILLIVFIPDKLGLLHTLT